MSKEAHQDPGRCISRSQCFEEISLNTVKNFSFGMGFKRLRNLQHVEASCYEDCDSYEVYIHNNSFEGLNSNNITQLILRGTAYKDIESGALMEMSHLSTLSTACARGLKIGSLFQSIYNMKAAALETIILDGMKALGPLLKSNSAKLYKIAPPFCHPRFQSLKRLSVRGNLIFTMLQLQNDNKSCLPNFHHINIGMNPILDLVRYYGTDYKSGQYVLKHGFPAKDFWSLSNVRTVDASHLFDQMFSLDYSFCKATEQDPENYFRRVPKVIEDIPDLANFNVTSGRIKSKDSENRTDIPSFRGVVDTIVVSPGNTGFLSRFFYPGSYH